jgi:hypothetical protein
MLVFEWRPGFAGTAAFLIYALSVPVALLGFLALLVWGAIGAVRSLRRGSVIRQRVFAVDYEWLLIWLDDSSHFERYAIVTD